MNIATMQQTMTSKEIADLTGKRHDHILADIRKMLAEIHSPEKPGQYKDSTGRTLPMLLLDKRETLILVSGYSTELRARIIDRWQELEAQPQHQIPQTYAAALLEAGRLAGELEKAQQQIEQARPAVEFVDRFVTSTGLMTFRQVAKLIKAKETEFREWLIAAGVMYRLAGKLTPSAYHVSMGRFEVKTGTSDSNGHAFVQTYFTPAGVEWVAQRWGARQALAVVHAAR